MDVVLVGAPGSGIRSLGHLLAEQHGARLVDLTGRPSDWADAVAGLRVAPPAEPAGPVASVICADRIVADPGVRARLYRHRRVLWLDVPAERLVERLRTGPATALPSAGDPRAAVAGHLAEFAPYFSVGDRIDGTAGPEAMLAQANAFLGRPASAGTLVLRAELGQGLIEVGSGILAPSLHHVLDRLGATRAVVVTTARHRQRAEAAVQAAADLSGVSIVVEELPDGEDAKRLADQEHLFRRLAASRLDRRSPLVGLGGESLLEAATFAAAVWLRGVPLIAVPVTMLGMLDAAIGGKGGINLPGTGRNLLGAIHQATATIIDVRLLAGEPDDDRRAALAEAVKYGLLGSAEILALLESGAQAGPATGWPAGSDLLELVERSALAKRRLVAADEQDTEGIRIALNLGHTVSHAIEAATGFAIRHGEAVGYGLRAALGIGVALGITPRSTALRATRLLDWLGLGLVPLGVSVDDVMGYLEADKKRVDGHLRWVLVSADGISTRTDVPQPLVRETVAAVLAGGPGPADGIAEART